MRMLLQLRECCCTEQLVFEQRQAAEKKVVADLRMLLRLWECECTEQSVFGKNDEIGGWKQLVLAFILFSCYSKR